MEFLKKIIKISRIQSFPRCQKYSFYILEILELDLEKKNGIGG